MATKKSVRSRKAVKRLPKGKAARGKAAAAPGAFDVQSLIDVRKLDDVVELELPDVDPQQYKSVEAIRRNPMLARMADDWNAATPAVRERKLREMIGLRQLSNDDLARGFALWGVKQRTVKRGRELEHTTDDWFGGYFKGPVARIVLEGMILAAQRSVASGLPVDLYWVASAGRGVKVSVAESAYQVTMLLMTPPTPAKQTRVRRMREPESLWVVSGRGRKAVVQQVYPTALAKK
ncbi:MAG: hypothetical protein PVI30_02405 [Myxococcales bacterium]|jgi:hypothetical protein